MPRRYYFDLESGQDAIQDEQGVMADGLESAIAQALLGLAEMRGSGELPESTADWELVIRDNAGSELKRIRL